MIAEAEIMDETPIQSGKMPGSYSPKQAEKRYLLKEVKKKFGIVKDICDRHDHCQECDYMLEVLSHPLKYPDFQSLQSCNLAAYTNDQLKQLLDIPL